MPKYPLILSLLLVFALGCEREAGEEEQLPVIFGAAAGAEDETRAGGDVIDVGNLASMGVFASYTGQNDWSEDAAPDFMYNQLVEKSNGTWTYAPLKYWPNTTGDKLTFFAYAPHTDRTDGSLSVSSTTTTAGSPKLSYTVPTDAADQIDLLAAVPLKDKTRGNELSFKMGHVLTHVSFKVEITGDGISLTSLSVKNCNNQGELTFSEDSYSWTSLQGTETFKGFPADVDGTNTFEFFLLPSKGSSNIELAFSEGGSSKKLTSELSGPDWIMGGSVVYTLKIGGVAISSVSESGENAHLSVSAISTF